MNKWVKAMVKHLPTGKYIFILRDDEPNIPQPNTRSMIWWWMEDGEDRKTALIREAEEELGIHLDNLHLLFEKDVYRKIQWKTITVHGHYVIATTNESLDNKKLTEWQKFELMDIDEIKTREKLSASVSFFLEKYSDQLD